jgi:hypothetical protein
VAIKVNNGWVKGVVNVRQAITSFFQNHYASSVWARPTLDGIEFPKVSQVNNQFLVALFSLEEIDAVVKESDGNKSLGPDGFNFNFLKAFWELLRLDFAALMFEFHQNACLPKGILSYFVTLIPKIGSPQSLGDFRPIRY